MAVSFKVEDVIISALRDRAMFNTFAGNQSYIIKDIGQELEVLYSSQSFVVQLGTGEAVICGGSMVSEGEENTLTLGQNESGYIVIRIDLSQTGTNICQFYNTPTLVQGNINNGSDYIYDLPLYQYVTNSNGVQNMNDIRSIKETSMSFSDLTKIIVGMGAGKTLLSLKQENGLLFATFQDISILKSQVSDFAHNHGNIANGGTLGTDVASASGDKFVMVDASDNNKIIKSNIALGNDTNTFLRNDGTWASPSSFGGIDVNNVLSTSSPYTPTQDCWCYFYGDPQNISYELKIDGVTVGLVGGNNSTYRVRAGIPIPIKKGQTVSTTGGTVKFFGIKS